MKSVVPGSVVEHFVTPKKSTDLNQDYVELKAVGVDTPTFNQFLEWEGGEVGSATDKRKVKRDATGMTEVKIKVKQSGAVAAQMNVWVVWAAVTATAGCGGVTNVSVQFPVNPLEGSDDAFTEDEDCNPYVARNIVPSNGLNHPNGQITSRDAPQFFVMNSWGATGRRFGFRVNFREFARVQLWDGTRTSGNFWFKISDNFEWHHKLSATYSATQSKWLDTGSASGPGALTP